jgi:hypothetical protein
LSSDERIAPKIQDYLNAINSGKTKSQEGQDNANRIISALQRTVDSDQKKPISDNMMKLIAKEYTESAKVLGTFTQIRGAIHKASRIFRTGDKGHIDGVVFRSSSPRRKIRVGDSFQSPISATHLG